MDGLGYSINLLIFREILQEISLRKTSAIITWNGGPGPKTTRSVFSGRENNLWRIFSTKEYSPKIIEALYIYTPWN